MSDADFNLVQAFETNWHALAALVVLGAASLAYLLRDLRSGYGPMIVWKIVDRLGGFPLPVEVIPLAREAVAREVRQLGGQPRLREGFTTDNGNQILDVAGLRYGDPAEFEAMLNNIPGVVCCGLFAIAGAQVALVAGQGGVSRLELRD